MNNINININGSVIINGKVINGQNTGNYRKIDETRLEYYCNVENINIDSTIADVNVSTSNIEKISVRLHGEANLTGDVKLDVQNRSKTIYVSVKNTGSFSNSNLKLDIVLPYKLFNEIYVNTMSADVIIDEGVCVNYIKVNSKSGDFASNIAFKRAEVNTMSGDIEIEINAKEDIFAELSTKSGDVNLDLKNIRYVNLLGKSMSGTVRNKHENSKGYIANLQVSTMSGDIMIK